MIEFNCPHCGETMQAENASAGLVAECPECGQSLRVPKQATAKGRKKIYIRRQSASGTSTARSRTKAQYSGAAARMHRRRSSGTPMSDEAKGCLILIGLGVCAFIFVAILTSGGSSSNPSSPAHDKAMAWVMAQSFIEQRLKAPSTAKWPWGYDDKVLDLGGGRYKVKGYVDSENGFRAMIRTRFTLDMQYTPQGWNIRLIDLD